jgi:tetratricopeptide (TPR) repeat protein
VKYSYSPKGRKPRTTQVTPQLAGMLQAAEKMVEHGNWPQAETLARRVILEAPGHPGAQGILGILAVEKDDFKAGIQLLAEALAAGYRSAAAYRYYGYALKQLGLVDRALEAYQKGWAEDSRDPALASNIASALMVKANWPEARKWVKKALDLQPGFADARLNQGLLDLQAGDLIKGWEGYEARWDLPGFRRPVFGRSVWGGTPTKGKHLLLYPDQGLGDSLMFARYVPKIAAMGLAVHLLVQKELKAVFETLDGTVSVHTYDEELPEFDLHTSLPSLPRLFKTTLETIPWNGPYLGVPARVPHRAQLDAALAVGTGKRIGLVWQGNPSHGHDAYRSIPAEVIRPLAELPGLTWFSLQLGAPDPLPLPGMVDLAPHLTDFADTAHALAELDVLVSVDTSVAHMAGAMGKPVLLLLHQNTDWRWFLERQDSPWYPGHTLLRQDKYGDWFQPVAAAAALLKQNQK